MKRKTVVLIGALALTLAGCSKDAVVDSATETSEIVESTEQVSETESLELTSEVESSEQAAMKETETEIAFPEGETVRTIYAYSTRDYIDVESEESLKTSIIREVSNEQEEERFLADYRKAHQIEGDGEELSQNGYSKVICYEKSAEGVAHFLIHDPLKNEEEYPKDIICFEVNLGALEKEGYLSYETDQKDRKIHESVYDAQKELVHSVFCQYEENIPFPIVSEISGDGGMSDLFALNADTLEYGADGRIVGYKGHPHQWMLELDDDDTLCHGTCEYDEAGRLRRMKEDAQTVDDEYYEEPGHLDISYGDNGKISKVAYGYTHMLHATWNSSGTVLYDELGRPTYRYYYVTHGGHYGWFLYQGEEQNPYAYIEVCSMPYSGSEEEPESWGVDVALTFWS